MSSPEPPSAVDEVKAAAQQASAAVDEGITAVSHGMASVIRTGASVTKDVYDAACRALQKGQGYVQVGVSAVKSVEDAAVESLKDGLAYAAAYPAVTYPALVTAGVLAFPGTRRLLWWATFGRFVKAEALISKNQSKVELLSSKLTDYQAQIQKLEERAQKAEEEYLRGYQGLRAARLEFQRLASQVSSSEKTARGVLRDLRTIKKVDASLALRGEAANQASTLKSQLTRVNKAILRIAGRDI